MRESQYQIPSTGVLHEGGSAETSTTQEVIRQQVAEVFLYDADFHYSHEQHAAVRRTEAAIDRYRQDALQTPIVTKQTMGGKILSSLGFERRVLPTMSDLVDTESHVGGQLFRQPQTRFWLHPTASKGDTTRDWYFNFVQDEQEYTIHYQTDGQNIHKIYNGRERVFTVGEVQRFTEAVDAYGQSVAKQMYERPPVS